MTYSGLFYSKPSCDLTLKQTCLMRGHLGRGAPYGGHACIRSGSVQISVSYRFFSFRLNRLAHVTDGDTGGTGAHRESTTRRK